MYFTEKGENISGPHDNDYVKLMESYSVDCFGQIPNKEIGDWANLSEREMIGLADMNDKGDSFETISHYIEEHH